ncbi:P-loop containing nucleoside triphosphate hydrolase protein [Nemania sp. FL0916]|nr:P-loop containing nucleoside triphosphate hydrolase protein [Nemania sp. FL0916]
MTREIDTIPTPKNVKPKKLVVLSAPRTGTHGIYKALKQLGFKPYHMAEVMMSGLPGLRILSDAMNAELFHNGTPYGREEFDKWFANYDVIIEMPFFALHSMIKAYPDAQFLLTERDPEKWATSFINTAGMSHQRFNSLPMSLFKHFDGFASKMSKFGDRWVGHCTNGFYMSDEGRRALVENYKDYIAEVKRLVPPEQLKIFRLEDGFGWNELCPCVGVPVPDIPWPSLNTPEEFRAVTGPQFQKAARKGMAGVTTIVAIAAIGMWYGRRSLMAMLS